ncbi:MAG: hypothetical protein K0S65_2706 [Labilithrix sp.]|nr:hypothetical protein [Labilithrix sp.]
MGAALAALGLGAVIAGSIASRTTASAPAPAGSPASPATASAVVVEEGPREGNAEVVTPDALPSAPPSEAASARPRLAAKAEANPSRPTQAETVAAPKAKATSTLAREIALLDAVRTRLVAGDTARADLALAAYDAEFPDGLLRPEATVLRARSLLAQGRRADAERLAQEYLARDPNSVHATRIRALFAN